VNLKLMLEETVGRYGGKTAIVLGERRLSYAGLNEASIKVASALVGMGVARGDRVALLLPNSPEFVAIYFGIVRVGAIAVPLDIKYKVDELTSLFNDCQPKVLVTESPVLELLIPALPGFKSIKHVIDMGSRYEGRFLGYREIMAMGAIRQSGVEPEPDDIAHIAYTSGPTLSPRGAMLPHNSLVAEAAISAEGFRQTGDDIVMLFALPMHHALGLVAVLLTSISKGSTVVMVPGTGLSISTLMEVVGREKGTILMGVPYIYALAVHVAEKEGVKNDLSSLRLCGSSGDTLYPTVMKRFKELYGFNVVDGWALTETGCHVTCMPLDGAGKLGSVGKALPGWEVKIVGDNGRELPPNQPGEMVVRGPIMKGYYNNPQATAEVMKDGWLYTGDIGRVDEDGYLFFLGRRRKLIIVKGQNIYPGDIEAVLRAHPRVAGAVVTGVSDELRGEVIRAVISLKEGGAATEQEIRHFCLERMANYKVPRQFIFVDSLPETGAA
jgi:long-chain acyl-CoA synthetase